MSTTRAIEYRITRQIMRRRDGRHYGGRAEGLITAVSVVAVLGVLAAFVPGLLWAMLLGSVVLILGLK